MKLRVMTWSCGGLGDLLGAEQSGHVAAIGYELYMQLLEDAVEHVKGRKDVLSVEPEIKLPFSAVIPESWMPDPMYRLDLYRKLSTALSDEEIWELEEDAVGSSGKPPEEFRSLVEMMLHRRRLKRLGKRHECGSRRNRVEGRSQLYRGGTHPQQR